ncbi:MAG: hypothetical protein ACRCUS_04820 [Anaerovoracaceae bacterium]
MPVAVSYDVSSLSAILLDEDYYSFLLEGRISKEGISLLSAPYIIPFKMKAWLDLSNRKEKGEKINSDDIKKHKNDVFRLYQILGSKPVYGIPTSVQKDINDFFAKIVGNEPNLSDLNLNFDIGVALLDLKNIFGVE